MKFSEIKINLAKVIVLALFVSFFVVPSKMYALPDSLLSYQGRLADSSGNLVANGTYNITFSIYTDAATSGSSWSETQSVAVKNGIFSVMLGSVNPITLDFNAKTYYLGIKVGSDSEMTPRTQIGAAPFSVNSKKLDGKAAGTGANNILELNNSGEIEIEGAIRGGGGLYITDGSIELPQGSIDGSYISNSAIDANKLNISAINSAGKIQALSSDYLADLNGSNLTGIVASDIADGIITNAKVSNTAAIAYSKLNLATSVQGSDLVSNISINTTGNIEIGNTGALRVDNVVTNTGQDMEINVDGGIEMEVTAGSDIDFINDGTNFVRIDNSGDLEVLNGDISLSGEINDLRVEFGNILMDISTIIGISPTDAYIEFESANAITVSNAMFGIGRLPIDSLLGIYSSSSDDYSEGANVDLETDTGTVYGLKSWVHGGATTNYGIYSAASGATNNYSAYLGGRVKGDNTWTGSETGAWGGFTKSVAMSTISSSDLVYITPTSSMVGTKFWVTVSDGVGFVVNSDNGAETMEFNWMIISQ